MVCPAAAAAGCIKMGSTDWYAAIKISMIFLLQV
jgi:hypothetical protein